MDQEPATVAPSAAEMQQTFDSLTTTLEGIQANIDAGVMDNTDALAMIENIATVVEMLQVGQN